MAFERRRSCVRGGMPPGGERGCVVVFQSVGKSGAGERFLRTRLPERRWSLKGRKFSFTNRRCRCGWVNQAFGRELPFVVNRERPHRVTPGHSELPIEHIHDRQSPTGRGAIVIGNFSVRALETPPLQLTQTRGFAESNTRTSQIPLNTRREPPFALTSKGRTAATLLPASSRNSGSCLGLVVKRTSDEFTSHEFTSHEFTSRITLGEG